MKNIKSKGITMVNIIRIRSEPCSICNKTLALGIPADKLAPDVTGLDLLLDLHGIDDEQSHARLLYVDVKGVVRTISTITKFTSLIHQNAASD